MTSTTADLHVDVERDSASRQQRLTEAVRGLRTRAGGAEGARTLLIIGGILVPLGFVLILLGWSGASGTVNLFEQIPYAISGGMLGLGLIFTGAFCYFAYWLTQLVYAVRRDAADNRAVLERIEELLAGSAAMATAAAPVRRERQAKPVAAATFLATATGTMFHRADCPAVAGRDKLREVTGDEPGLTPCRICEPAT